MKYERSGRWMVRDLRGAKFAGRPYEFVEHAQRQKIRRFAGCLLYLIPIRRMWRSGTGNRKIPASAWITKSNGMGANPVVATVCRAHAAKHGWGWGGGGSTALYDPSVPLGGWGRGAWAFKRRVLARDARRIIAVLLRTPSKGRWAPIG